MFKILAFDGGGIRGAFGCALLAELERGLGRPLAAHFDLIAGTSTGAILGAALAAGKTGADLVDFYRTRGPDIFHPRPPFKPRPLMRPVFPVADRVFRWRTGAKMEDFFRARYCPLHLRDSFEAVFGGTRLRELKHRLVVPSVNLTRGRVHLFRTPHLPDSHPGCGDRDAALSVVDVLLAATAAPTYFPHHVLPDGDAYCDGGIWANNPAVLAVGEAVKLAGGDGFGGERSDVEKALDVTGICVLSVGAGNMTYSLKPPGADAGALFWAQHIADVMGNSMQQGTDLPARFFLGDRYVTVNFDVPDATWALDRTDRIPDLFELGKKEAARVRDRVGAMFFA